MAKKYIDTADFRYQAISTLAKDWTSPYTGTTHKKGAIIEFSAITEYSKDFLISFPIPNASALYLNLSHRLFKESQQTLEKVERSRNPSDPYTFVEDVNEFMDLLEIRLASIIFAFIALEVFANQTIPDKFTYERERDDGKCKEVYTKEQAEKWISLDDKLGVILPSVLSVKSPKGRKVWDKYKKLKAIRDRLIHPKSKDLHSTGPEDNSIWNTVTRRNLDDPSIQSKEIIKYFMDGMTQKPRWFEKLPF